MKKRYKRIIVGRGKVLLVKKRECDYLEENGFIEMVKSSSISTDKATTIRREYKLIEHITWEAIDEVLSGN